MSIQCPKCSAENPDTKQFCGDCGTPLESNVAHTKTIETPIEELTTGLTFAGRYQIIEELGKGGMGRVYKVLDKETNEKIALKLIKPEIASDKNTIERFRNELTTARKIGHRNVCRMYDLNKEKNNYYITMEFVSGGDLKKLIRRTKQLSVGTAVSIAKQICEGLEGAHGLGIVHRDLKPHNIMIDDNGNARIMDFGIARSVTGKGITDHGVMIGTPEYMSPEQAEAKNVDSRSDIYSLGVILFEMVTGQLPFHGKTSLAIAMKHKDETPRHPKEFNSHISDNLSRIILKCLEKERESRYQTADDLRAELERIEQGLPTTDQVIPKRKPRTSKEITVQFTPKKLLIPVVILAAALIAVLALMQILPERKRIKPTIAVISFENQTGDTANDNLSKIIPNLLITSLEQSGNFKVTTWERIYDVLEQMGSEDVEFIDTDLGFDFCHREEIDAIVLGSFAKAGDIYVTNLQVLDVRTKDLLKSASAKGEGVGSILNIQIDELSRQISRGIGLSSGKAEGTGVSIADVTTDSMEAYEHYLKGKESYNKFYFEEAKEHFKKALELDPRFSMAHFLLGQTYFELAERDSGIAAYTRAHEFSDRATEKERLFIEAEYVYWIEGATEMRFELLQELVKKYPKEKLAHLELGIIYNGRDMYQESIDALSKALELDPNWDQPVNMLAYSYSDMGDYDKALEYFRRYAELSPEDANPIDSMAEQYFRMGRLDEAILKYKEALAIKPDFDAGLRLALVRAFKEDYSQAFTELDRFIDASGSPGRKAEAYLWKGIFNFLLGRREEAFQNLTASRNQADRVRAGTIDHTKGWMHFELGQYDLSRENLNAAWDTFLSYFPNSRSFKIRAAFCSGLVDARQGRIDSAKSRLETIRGLSLKLSSPSGKKSSSFRQDWLQAEILMAQGAAGEAVGILEKMEPQSVPSLQTDIYGPYNMPFRRDVLARAYYQSGRLDDAIVEYEQMTEFVPGEKDWHLTHPIYYFLLGQLYEEKGMEAKAAENFTKFLNLWQSADPGLLEVDDARKRLAGLKNK